MKKLITALAMEWYICVNTQSAFS